MENPNNDNFFESYLDIDSWADDLREKEYEVQSRRKKRILQKKQRIKMANQNKNHDKSKSKDNGRKIRNGKE